MQPEDRYKCDLRLNLAANSLSEARGMLEAGAPCLEVVARIGEVYRVLVDMERLLIRAHLHSCMQTILKEACLERRLEALHELTELHEVYSESIQ